MFQLGSLEKWLEDKASAGYVLTSVKFGYLFTFTKDEPVRLAYAMDYRRYLIDDYVSELGSKNWVMKKVNSNWIVWSKPYNGNRPLLNALSDEEMLKGIKRTTIIQSVVDGCLLIVALFISMMVTDYVVKTMVYLAIAYLLYHILRLVFYQSMLQVRIERGVQHD